MPIDIKVLAREIKPENTVLFFGAGSSIPSGAKSGPELAEAVAGYFKLDYDQSMDLSEIATLVEKRTHTRRALVDFLKSILTPIRPTGSLLNLPHFDWKTIFTTNYDKLIEQTYRKAGVSYKVIRSNFDFQSETPNEGAQIFKLHGSIEQDVSTGHQSRMVISTSDYDNASEYREMLFERLKIDMNSSDVIIVGYSLSDSNIQALINEVLRRRRESGAGGRLYLLMYKQDHNRALIYEDRGFTVSFGGLDEFFDALSQKLPETQLAFSMSDDPVDFTPELRPVTVDVAHAIDHAPADLSKMFNGSPATYGDIRKNWTFTRKIAQTIESVISTGNERITYILGVAGVGKTTAVRQAMYNLSQRGVRCWEHKEDFVLSSKRWARVDAELKKRSELGVLFIDDCHGHIREVNRLADHVAANQGSGLKLILVSTPHQWNPRTKTPSIFAQGVGYDLTALHHEEINFLLDLVEREQDIKRMVEQKFLGFSRSERRRRLEDRCGADMFVCMKNIFGFDKIDDIILEEFATLYEPYQDIYRYVAAMEAAGVRVHRQLVIRILGINANSVQGVLENMSGIVYEYTVSEKQGLYGWKCRHDVIADIVAQYKFDDEDEFYRLIDTILDHLNPTYQMEVRSIKDLCDMEAGLGRIPDRTKQNSLLRKMISLAPGERVPRHRLISNLIDIGDLEEADKEIRLFENELRTDPPVTRYKVQRMLKRASTAKNILDGDRATIIRRASALAQEGLQKFPEHKNMYRVYCEVGLQYVKITGDWEIYDDAMNKLKEAEERIMDPDIRRIISQYERMATRLQSG